MSGATFPNSHTTAVAPPASAPERRIYVNTGYLRSLHGLLKIAHMVLSIILFICAMMSRFVYHARSNYLAFVAMTGFWSSAILLFLYVINVVTYLTIVPWVRVELFYTALMAFFAFVAGCVAADGAANGFDAPYGAAAFFGFALMLVYAANAFILFRLMRDGVRLVTTETTTVTTTVPK
ncbi:CKLF-like MARVEL transmembrane domain-containing protein 4 [Hyalella azteca]|uniref:CKLF-like MARVEL transmembrane domain-containing protein 4 n=1 Tax=Hyalella azteca TaxID=294128 RepID=A0A8B7P2D0_HYAAZ|nr:CKLF-like MARVEL transmembrane domain-containing protein 4 [Hyalella azteca]